MSWAIGFHEKQNRHIGYGVLAICDHPECTAEIDRGVAYMCCENPHPSASCEGFYCGNHRPAYIYGDELEDMEEDELEALGIDVDSEAVAEAIEEGDIVKCRHEPIQPNKENAAWLEHVLKDESWSQWREENPEKVTAYQTALENKKGNVCIVQLPPSTESE